MFSDALDRETAWLNTVDSLPALNATNGGPFEIVQARWPRVAATRKTGLYVLRAGFRVRRESSQRSIATTVFQLRLSWPLATGTGSAEAGQLAFEQAIDAVLARVQGPIGDKTHGGRFLSVAEEPAYLQVEYGDPEQAMNIGIFTARVTYSGDDPDYTN